MDYKWILTRGTDGDGRVEKERRMETMKPEETAKRDSHRHRMSCLHLWFFTHCPDNGTSIIDLSLIRLLQGSHSEERERNRDSRKMREPNISN